MTHATLCVEDIFTLNFFGIRVLCLLRCARHRRAWSLLDYLERKEKIYANFDKACW
ncbi:hypothetical protein THIOM_003110 [Candidatus Thiomargarita nelsonii]|uniref:Uncharacterized protein n=1 Tax=Candidatus Thiomargarita nelsonii TaxID=1003181 RepID=A0A176RZK9_9GAMM|nr:hypothetical protein THIOM_003110 [Candidatus Thiomargarita nelsonii]